MSGEIVNLRRARKDKARRAAQAEAAENRAKFGRSKIDKALDERRRAEAERMLEGHRRDAKDRTVPGPAGVGGTEDGDKR